MNIWRFSTKKKRNLNFVDCEMGDNSRLKKLKYMYMKKCKLLTENYVHNLNFIYIKVWKSKNKY